MIPAKRAATAFGACPCARRILDLEAENALLLAGANTAQVVLIRDLGATFWSRKFDGPNQFLVCDVADRAALADYWPDLQGRLIAALGPTWTTHELGRLLRKLSRSFVVAHQGKERDGVRWCVHWPPQSVTSPPPDVTCAMAWLADPGDV